MDSQEDIGDIEIKAFEYEMECGSTTVEAGIILMRGGREVCRMTEGTIEELAVARLFQAAPRLLRAARSAIAGQAGWEDRLEDAILYAEGGEIS